MAGRAGRGDNPGLVIVQTYTPGHFALRAAQKHDFLEFYEAEMPSREALDFPQFSRMLMIHFRGTEEALVSAAAEKFAGDLQPLLDASVQVIGPMPAPLAKINKYFRYQLLLRGHHIRKMADCVRRTLNTNRNRKVSIYLDIDPRSLL